MTTADPRCPRHDPRSSHLASVGGQGRHLATTFGSRRHQEPGVPQRRGVMITMVVLIVAADRPPLRLRLLFHAVNPNTYSPAGSPGLFSQLSNLIAEFGFIAAATLGATAGTTDLTDGMFRHLVITGRSRVALYLARIPAGLAVIIPLVALAFTMNCLVTSFEGSPTPRRSALYGVNARSTLTRPDCRTGCCSVPQQACQRRTARPPERIAHRPRGRPSPRRRSHISARLIGHNISRLLQPSTPPPRSAARTKPGRSTRWPRSACGSSSISGSVFLVGLGFGSLTGQRTDHGHRADRAGDHRDPAAGQGAAALLHRRRAVAHRHTDGPAPPGGASTPTLARRAAAAQGSCCSAGTVPSASPRCRPGP